jgi:hypothetical protein
LRVSVSRGVFRVRTTSCRPGYARSATFGSVAAGKTSWRTCNLGLGPGQAHLGEKSYRSQGRTVPRLLAWHRSTAAASIS